MLYGSVEKLSLLWWTVSLSVQIVFNSEFCFMMSGYRCLRVIPFVILQFHFDLCASHIRFTMRIHLIRLWLAIFIASPVLMTDTVLFAVLIMPVLCEKSITLSVEKFVTQWKFFSEKNIVTEYCKNRPIAIASIAIYVAVLKAYGSINNHC